MGRTACCSRPGLPGSSPTRSGYCRRAMMCCIDVQSNLVGTVNFLRSAVGASISKVIFVSSGGTVYGKPASVPIKETAPTDPLCSYGITKLAIEKYLALFELLHGLDYLVFRLSNPFGEGQRPGAQGAIAAFMQKMLQEQPIEVWGDGSVVR